MIPTHTDIDDGVLAGYEEFDIGIVPTIRSVGGLPPNESQTIDESDNGFHPPPVQARFDEFGASGESTTLEECISLSRMLWNTPGMLMGDHLTRSDEQIELYGKELYLYCSKKGIDPRDYVGDWMPLAVMTGTMGIGLYKDHKAFKNENKAAGELNRPAKQFDTGKGVTSSGGTAEHEPLSTKENPNPASSCGGDYEELENIQ